jgi:hypothetical protein
MSFVALPLHLWPHRPVPPRCALPTLNDITIGVLGTLLLWRQSPVCASFTHVMMMCTATICMICTLRPVGARLHTLFLDLD